MRGGQKAFSILPRTVFFSYCRSFSVTHTLSYFLYEVRGVRVARKINNYEARGDDSNGEIKVSQSKVILRILCYSHFVFVFALLRNYSLDHGNVAMIVKTGSTRGNLHLLHALKHVPFRILYYKSEFTFPYTRCSYKITFSPFFKIYFPKVTYSNCFPTRPNFYLGDVLKIEMSLKDSYVTLIFYRIFFK